MLKIVNVLMFAGLFFLAYSCGSEEESTEKEDCGKCTEDISEELDQKVEKSWSEFKTAVEAGEDLEMKKFIDPRLEDRWAFAVLLFEDEVFGKAIEGKTFEELTDAKWEDQEVKEITGSKTKIKEDGTEDVWSFRVVLKNDFGKVKILDYTTS